MSYDIVWAMTYDDVHELYDDLWAMMTYMSYRMMYDDALCDEYHVKSGWEIGLGHNSKEHE